MRFNGIMINDYVLKSKCINQRLAIGNWRLVVRTADYISEVKVAFFVLLRYSI